MNRAAEIILLWTLACSASAYAPHQPTVSATRPSGLFSTNASIWFTNSAANEAVSNYFDGGGLLTQRVWRNASGTTNRTQNLAWDVKQRLTGVSERDSLGNGYEWSAGYNPLGRRLWSTAQFVGNSASLGTPVEADSVFDPSVEFLELGVGTGDYYNYNSVWKLYGPDLNGRYGGMNGVGGLDAVVTETGIIDPTISDARGNVLAYYDPSVGSNIWAAARPTGYGAVPGRRPLPLTANQSVVQASAWRGKWPDITGYCWLGARYYNPESGSFLSADPAWNSGDPNYFTFAGGDPINAFDPDGRFVKAIWQKTAGGLLDNAQQQANLNNYANSFSAEFVSDIIGDTQGAQKAQQLRSDASADMQARDQQYRSYVNALNDFYGGNQFLVFNQQYNPMVEVELSLGELSSDRGYHPNNAGLELDRSQLINSAANFTLAGAQTIGTASLFGEAGASAFGAFRTAMSDSLGSLGRNFYLPGEQLPNGLLAGEGPGAMFSGETGARLVGDIPAGDAFRRTVYNSANGELWVGSPDQALHVEVLSDAIKNGGWRLVGDDVNSQYIGGHATFVNGQLTEWNWTSGHILGTPAIQAEAEAAAKAISGR